MTWFDYDGDGGTTIRFGDGTFGASPLPGHELHRASTAWAAARPATSPPTRSSASPPGQARASIVAACTNPFPATGGADAETIAAGPRPRAAAVPRGAAARRAGRGLRGRGAVAALGAAGGHHVPLDRQLADRAHQRRPGRAARSRRSTELELLTDLLNRRRLAGYESYVLPPRYVSVDLQITVCGQPAYVRAATCRPPCSPACSPGRCPAAAAASSTTHGGASARRWSRARCSPRSSRARRRRGLPGPVPPARRPARLGAAAGHR